MSGTTVQLVAGDARATIDVAHGARLASLLVGGRQRLLGSDDAGGDPVRWGCYLMAPWAGRIADARLRWAGSEHPLRPDEGGHALHGVVRDRAWSVAEATDRSAAMTLRVDDDAWPWSFAGRQELALRPDGLSWHVTIEPLDGDMPVSLGWHPWFRRPDEGDMAIEVAAGRLLETDAVPLPTGRVVDVDATTDLRHAPRLGARRLDHAYVDVLWPSRVRWPDLELAVAADQRFSTAVVHTPQSGVCVEPQSAWPDAANLASRGVTETGIATAGPGRPMEGTMTWQWRSAS